MLSLYECFKSGKAKHDRENLHSKLQLLVGRIGGGKTKILVLGIATVPLEDCNTSLETNEYCKWCYSGGKERLEACKEQLIHELNTLLHIEGLPKVENLNVLPGEFVNLEYTLPNGEKVKFLDDQQTYLGSQLECESGDKCLGIVANMDFLLVCAYEENGENPELLIYKKR